MSDNEDFSVGTVSVPALGEWFTDGRAWFLVLVIDGVGYWRVEDFRKNLSPGDVVISPGGCRGHVRASQVSAMELKTVHVHFEYLRGFLSFDEQEQIAALERLDRNKFYFPGDHPLAMQSKSVILDNPSTGILHRIRILELFFQVIAPELKREIQMRHSGDARLRLRSWLSRNPEFALLEVTIQELAAEMRCSIRHFSRLFTEEIGVPFRERQKELRLLRACQLLGSTDSKVIDVALESGYRSVGLFNALFKRRFGVAPSVWRENNGKSAAKPRRRSPKGPMVAVLAFLLGSAQFAPIVTLAAPVATTNSVAAPVQRPTTNQVFAIMRYQVEGNTLLATNTLDAIFSGLTGPQCTRDTLGTALKSLILAYRGRGYATVQVDPKVVVENGTCVIRVVEGRLSEIRVIGNRWFSTENVRRALPDLRTNIILNDTIFLKELNQANLNPDRQIYSRVLPGPVPGSSVLELKIKDQIPLHGRFELNNQYTPGTPQLRGNASAQYNNLWQREHSVGLQYGFALQEFKQGENVNLLDRPLIANYSGYYRLPLSSEEPIQPTLDANPRKFGYNETTRQFTLPPSQGRSELTIYANRSTTDTGVKTAPLDTINPPPVGLYSQDSGQDLSTTEGVGFRISKPLPEFYSIRSTLSFGADLKNYQRASYNTNNFLEQFTFINPSTQSLQTNSYPFTSAQPVRTAHVSYLPLAARWDGSHRDSLGTTSLGVGLNVNFAGGPFSDSHEFANTAGTTNASGTYVTLQMAAAREVKLPAEWLLLIKADGQWANEPLISNEQFGIGGISGGRGYLEGERYGDTGWRLTLEPRTPLLDVGLVDGTMPMRIQGAFFMDYGRSYSLNDSNPVHLETLWGTGFGVNAKIGRTFDFRAAVAWALRETATTPNGTFRIYFAVAAQF